MTIWILALLLFVLLALAGYQQGAIRAAVSLVGLIVSAALASPLSRMASPVIKILLGAFSTDNPVLVWAISPVAVFLILLTLFKVGGLMLHKKVAGFYKHNASYLRLMLWERMNQRLGACLGIANALIYLLLLSLVAYQISYCTTQMTLNNNGSKLVRLINRMGRDVVATGLVKAVRAIDPAPESYYEASDILGIVYHNPLTQGRLARYPAFLGLSERLEFQELANDKDFLEMLERQSPVMEILKHSKIQTILHNSALQKEIWGQVSSDLPDLHAYVETGQSQKYGNEPILGRWFFDTTASVTALKQSKPGGVSTIDMKRLRPYVIAAYGKASFIAMPDHQAMLKNVVSVKPGMVIKPELSDSLEKKSGQWQKADDKYSISLDNKELNGTISNGKLKLTGDWTPVVYSHED